MGALGWYVNKHLDRGSGVPWPAQMCYDWFIEDNRKGADWLNELEVNMSATSKNMFC